MTTNFLEACDILVNVNDGNDPVSVITRWGVGEYSHVSVYMGSLRMMANGLVTPSIPTIFESTNGKGVGFSPLSSRYGQKVVVMRLVDPLRPQIPEIIYQAAALAHDPQTYYDYQCIIRFVLLRIVCQKLHLPMPLAWHRDKAQICSEAAFEIFYRALVLVLPQSDPRLPAPLAPLPGDFVSSPVLENKGIITLCPECV